jgi:hypothetical protein
MSEPEKIRYMSDRDLRHLNSIPVLIDLIKRLTHSTDPEVAGQAAKTLRDWDKARG